MFEKKIKNDGSIFFGNLKPLQIDEEKVKCDFLESYYFKEKNFSLENFYDLSLSDDSNYSHIFTLLKERFYCSFNKKIFFNSMWGNIFHFNEGSQKRNNLKYGCSYTAIICIDKKEKNCSLVFNYDDISKKDLLNEFNFEKMCYVFFPSNLNYFFIKNKNEKPCFYLTINFNCND